MTAPRYARIAARLLSQEQPASIDANDAKRARAIHTIAEALAAKKRRRMRRSWGFGLATVLAASVLAYVGVRKLARSAGPVSSGSVFALAKPSGSGTTIWGAAGSQALRSATQFQQGGRLVAGSDGGATVRLSTGTELTVEHDTTLAFESADRVERFFLSQGVLRAKVAKLSDGQRFIVRTDDAEVEVRGTAFRVEIATSDVSCGGGTRTRVSVSEGLVEVRGAGASTYIHQGESWPVGCAVHAVAAASAPASPASVALEKTPQRAKAPVDVHLFETNAAKRAQSSKATPSVEETSSIAQENELFSKAAAASRHGDNATALGAFEQLIARYPTSPLAESAAVQRIAVLAHNDPAAAKEAARQYLLRYPRGYARADAQKFLTQP